MSSKTKSRGASATPMPTPRPTPAARLATAHPRITASGDHASGGDEEVTTRRCAHPGCGAPVTETDWAYRSVVCTILEYGPEPLETQFHPRETRYYCSRRHAYAAIGW